MKIAVIGANGQLGTDLVETLGSTHEVAALTHADIQVEDLASCKAALTPHAPRLVINTAAFHQVPLCETDPEKAFLVNAIAARNLATLSNELGFVSAYISTDYVFDGAKQSAYNENDSAAPLMVYGVSKLAGEFFTRAYSDAHYVFRISSVFGRAGASGKGGNFVETMINKAKSGAPIQVVDDIIMTPTSTKSAARLIKAIIERSAPSGLYHCANEPGCSWFEFTQEIFRVLNLTPDLKPSRAADYPTPFKRPTNSALTSTKLHELGIAREDWREALREYLVIKGHVSHG